MVKCSSSSILCHRQWNRFNCNLSDGWSVLLVSPRSIACVVYMKNTATRQIRQIDCKWKQKPRFSCDSIWSAAYHQIACGATQRFHTNHICWAQDPAATQQPGQPRDSRARPSCLLRKISHGAGETKDRLMQCCVSSVWEKAGKGARWGRYRPSIWDAFVSHVHCFSMNVCSGDLFQMTVYMMISYCLPSLDLQDELCCSNQNWIPALHSPRRRSHVRLFWMVDPVTSNQSLLCWVNRTNWFSPRKSARASVYVWVS